LASLQQSRRLHDLTGLAVAALRHVVSDPGALHRVRAVSAQPFDRGDLLVADIADRGDAGPHGLAVQEHRAGAAGADAAAEFRPGKAEHVAQCPQQRHCRIGVDGACAAVQAQVCHRVFLVSVPGHLFAADCGDKDFR